MDALIGENPPPKSSDLEGWRQAIVDGHLKTLRLEAIAAAFQDLGQRDTRVRNALAKHLSDSILCILRRYVGFNHPNNGEDIIFRVHGNIFVALLCPTSADGRNLREAFVPRVLFRMKDAIASEARERRLPDETRPKEKHTTKKATASASGEEVEIIDLGDNANLSEETEATGDGEIVPQKARDETLSDGVRDANEQIDVDRILERVPDYKKRLAFYLFMNDVPYHSKKKDVTSIAQALSISDKTARDWVEEVRQLLKGDKDVKYLKDGK
jgi:hypothetical protein